MNFQEKSFDSAINVLSYGLKNKLIKLNPIIKSDTFEVRIRACKPLILFGKYGSLFLKKDGRITGISDEDNYICDYEAVKDTFNRLCCFSVYSHIESIINGYITYQGGHRAGITGTAVNSSESKVTGMRNISGINLRIAKEIFGSGDRIIKEILNEEICGIIIAGPPSSGKTTVLRDVIRQLSDKLYKVCIIDERQEIAAVNEGICQNDVGINTDVLDCFPKDKGIMNALKTLSPDIIALDEVGERKEIDGIIRGVNSGVKFIITLHAADYNDLLKRPQLEKLIASCSFKYVVLLENSALPGKIKAIYDTEELYDEIFRSRFNMDSIYSFGDENSGIA